MRHRSPVQQSPRTQHTRRLGGIAAGLSLVVAAGLAAVIGVSSASGPVTVFSSADRPAVASTGRHGSVELGMRFTVKVAGQLTGVRFYRGPGNTGTHVGTLWSSTGKKLRSVVFSRETQSGWQQATFATPLPVTAGSSFVVSYHSSTGRYSVTRGFHFAARSSATFQLPASRAGLYRYGSVGFPTQSYRNSNYWVDVVFSPTVTASSAKATSGAKATVGTSTTSGATTQLTTSSTTASGTASTSTPTSSTPSSTTRVASAAGSGTRLFGASSLWNTAKSGVSFAAGADATLRSLSYGLNSGAFSHPTYFAKASDPVTTFRLGAGWGWPATTITAPAPAGMVAASGSDHALTVLLADGRLLDLYGATVTGATVTAKYYGLSDGINGPGFGNPTTLKAIGTTAIGSPQGAGTILARDVAAKTIPHALSIAFDIANLGGVGTSGTARVLPAVAGDAGGGSGPLPEGGLLLIPAGTLKPAGLSPMGNALWDAAATYGVYITDQLGGHPMFYSDGSPTVTAAFTTTDLTTVGHALRLVKTW